LCLVTLTVDFLASK